MCDSNRIAHRGCIARFGPLSPKLFVSRQKNQSQLWIPRKPRKIGVWVSGAAIQTSAVDTRTAVWVSTAEKFSKIFLGKTRNVSRKFRGVSAPALYKNPAVNFSSATGHAGNSLCLKTATFWCSTGKARTGNNFSLEKYQRTPRNHCQYWC